MKKTITVYATITLNTGHELDCEAVAEVYLEEGVRYHPMDPRHSPEEVDEIDFYRDPEGYYIPYNIITEESIEKVEDEIREESPSAEQEKENIAMERADMERDRKKDEGLI